MNLFRRRRSVEAEKLSLFEERRSGNKRQDRQMVNLVELETQLSRMSTRKTRRKPTSRKRKP